MQKQTGDRISIKISSKTQTQEAQGMFIISIVQKIKFSSIVPKLVILMITLY
jgi:hypothetical protein